MTPAPAATLQVNPGAAELPAAEHVVARLKMRIREVKSLGFQVRQELLGGQPSSWCEIGGKKILFLDAAQSAREQLAAIDETLASYVPPRDSAH